MSYPDYPAGTGPLPANQQPFQQPYPPLSQPQPAGDPGTLDLPYYGIGFKDAIFRAYKKYARFDGRAGRGEFWWFRLFAVIAELILEIPFWIAYVPFLTGILRGETPSIAPMMLASLPLVVFGLATILPDIGLTVRRLHDANYSGWLYLLVLVPFGWLVILALCISAGKPDGRRFDRVRDPRR